MVGCLVSIKQSDKVIPLRSQLLQDKAVQWKADEGGRSNLLKEARVDGGLVPLWSLSRIEQGRLGLGYAHCSDI